MDFPLIPIPGDIVIDGFHSLYYFEFDRHFYHPPERHDFWELVYVDAGCITAIVDGIGVNLSAGQVIFHQPLEMHSHIANQRDTSSLVVLSFASQSPILSFFNRKIFSLEKAPKKILSLLLQEAEQALGELPHEFTNRQPLDFSRSPVGSAQLMQCYLVEFLFSLLRSDAAQVCAMQPTRDARQIAESSMADSIEQFMQQHLTEPPSLAVLCEHFSISRTTLCRIFKEAMGTGPVDHWIRLKMHEARKLLREDNCNVTQIAERLGYAGIHHFTRMFKRVTGLSPMEYRHSVRL